MEQGWKQGYFPIIMNKTSRRLLPTASVYRFQIQIPSNVQSFIRVLGFGTPNTYKYLHDSRLQAFKKQDKTLLAHSI